MPYRLVPEAEEGQEISQKDLFSSARIVKKWVVEPEKALSRDQERALIKYVALKIKAGELNLGKKTDYNQRKEVANNLLLHVLDNHYTDEEVFAHAAEIAHKLTFKPITKQ
ncbi:hypothetical protein COX85_01655 [Candidatus Micrarchaeota archaeon CG_4_10_14_0_2_um_filter_55_9]|nr:MAG: hypothetical protein AUJ15_02165 [Candidatus Micrarchaeota archaeon CG1_02_55_41]PIO02843.1 MAG: hypothetical protein COT57_02100 [Candidatus Micrarchaeota archaeon CG09_land_8_20_14_0_10_55_25]PIZ91854.1 MAG: hypothetical protein COX85_01655 [Candidatus Micrarchaeota archaeon CG_4_10_14_0_2_um_filter_55_9]PJD01243.1 MAG: hypothetical protein COU38_02195 [Candidatus Micrarchaeota archaeon CG10_big_fil_rev_8_21_14_0_10_54_18]